MKQQTNHFFFILHLIICTFFNSIVFTLAPTAAEQGQQLEQAPITHQTIAELLLTSYGVTTTEKPKEKDPDKKTEPSDREKLQKFYTLLIAEEPLYNVTPAKNREMRTFIKNLELFFTQGNEDHSKHFFSAIDRTQTVFGRAALAAMLVQPSSDIAILKKQQDTIRLLVENEALMNELLALVDQIKQVETAILNNYEHQDTASKQLYPDIGRQNVVFLELFTRYVQCHTALTGLVSLTLIPGRAAHNIIQSLRRSRSITIHHAYEGIQALFGLLGGTLFISLAKASADKIKELQTNVMGVRTLLDIVQKIKNITHSNTKLNLIIAPATSAQKSKNYKQLLQLLSSNTFTGKASYFSSAGRILAAGHLMVGCREDFIPFMKTIGELDALLSLARLIKGSKNKSVGYSFVTYTQQDYPYLELNGFWNPIVTAEHAIPNNITFGGVDDCRNATNIVLTGANTGGKSTALKAILCAILLAQTCCIAPAASLTITPFTSINASLKTIDNTAKGVSQFQAEADRIVDLMFEADALKDNECMFIATDELPNGTSGDQAEEVMYTFVKYLAANPHVLSAVATHFPKLVTQLEQETNGLCKNYRMEAYVNEHGELIRPFILEPGISESKIAQIILEKTFERRKAEREKQKVQTASVD
ncbi:MAG TPA: hypothetical protein VGT41_00785 [Candidatus Babeliales bacterium]|nr:hypothetical protein [Candidatus Babeliales bacterium]